AVEGHLAQESGDVGAADADAEDPDERLARGGLLRLVDLDLRVLPGLLEADGLHAPASAEPTAWPRRSLPPPAAGVGGFTVAGFFAARFLSPWTCRPRCFARH